MPTATSRPCRAWPRGSSAKDARHLGAGRGGRGAGAARLARPADLVTGAAPPPQRAARLAARERAGPRRTGRHGWLVTGPRGDRPHRRGRPDRAGHHRPPPDQGRDGRPARPDGARGVVQERVDGRDRQPPAGLREGVPRPGPVRRGARPADRRGDRPGLRAGGAGTQGGLRGGPRRPECRRPLQRAVRLRARAQRARRRRSSRGCSRPRARCRRSSAATRTTPACCSVPRSAVARRRAATSW